MVWALLSFPSFVKFDGAIGLDIDGALPHEIGVQHRHHWRGYFLAGHSGKSVASKFWR
jgi:hypothetical protein